MSPHKTPAAILDVHVMGERSSSTSAVRF